MTAGLKEWAAAVHALLDGRQTVLLRKGGIGEKRFAVESGEFLLFPTVAHSHAERVRPEHRDLLDAAAPTAPMTASSSGRPRRWLPPSLCTATKALPRSKTCTSGPPSRCGPTGWISGPATG